MLPTNLLNRLTTAITLAEEEALLSFRRGDIETEPAITDRFLGGLSIALKCQNMEELGYSVTSRTLRDRGYRAPEKLYGPDFAGLLSINTEELTRQKGFLVQAKMSGKSKFTISQRDHSVIVGALTVKDDVLTQSNTMLEITPESFIFVYSEEEIRVVHSTAIIGIHKKQEIPSMSLQEFYRHHFECSIGDVRLKETNNETLQSLQKSGVIQAISQIAIKESQLGTQM